MSRKLLIIDDDFRNVFALQAVLKAKNFVCVSAVNARDGIALLKSDSSIGMVLMDMMMPDMDGYEAIGLIRSDPDIKSTPIIAVTAQAMTGDKEKCMEAGASGYVSKPVNIDILLDLITAQAGRSGEE